VDEVGSAGVIRKAQAALPSSFMCEQASKPEKSAAFIIYV